MLVIHTIYYNVNNMRYNLRIQIISILNAHPHRDTFSISNSKKLINQITNALTLITVKMLYQKSINYF